MIEFYIIGSVFSYIQFKRYIDYSFDFIKYLELDSEKCSSSLDAITDLDESKYEFNRYEFLLLFLYNILNTLFVILIVFYLMYPVQYVIQKKKKNNNYSLFERVLIKHPKFRQYFIQPNLFLKNIVKFLLISFIANFVFVNLLILFRENKLEKDKGKIKVDLIIMFAFLIISSGVTFMYI